MKRLLRNGILLTACLMVFAFVAHGSANAAEKTKANNKSPVNDAIIAYVYVVNETCGWPLSEAQKQNIYAYKASKGVNWGPGMDFATKIGEVRNLISSRTQLNFCSDQTEKKKYLQLAAQIAPVGKLAIPPKKEERQEFARPSRGWLPEEPSWSGPIEATFNASRREPVFSLGLIPEPADNRDIEMRPDIQADRLKFYAVWSASCDQQFNQYATWSFFSSLYSCQNAVKTYDFMMSEFSNKAAADAIIYGARDRFLQSWQPRSQSITATFRVPLSQWSRQEGKFALKSDKSTTSRGSVGKQYVRNGGSVFLGYSPVIIRTDCRNMGPNAISTRPCNTEYDNSTMSVYIDIDGSKLATHCDRPGGTKEVITTVKKLGYHRQGFRVGYKFRIPPIEISATEEVAKEILARSPNREVDVTFTLAPGAKVEQLSDQPIIWAKDANVTEIEVREISGKVLRRYTPQQIIAESPKDEGPAGFLKKLFGE